MKEGLHPPDEKGNPKYLERGSAFTFVIVIPMFHATLIYASYLWTIYVDPPCGKVVCWLSKKAFGEGRWFRVDERRGIERHAKDLGTPLRSSSNSRNTRRSRPTGVYMLAVYTKTLGFTLLYIRLLSLDQMIPVPKSQADVFSQ